MSFRNIFCDLADTLRSLTGPDIFNIYPTGLTIRTRFYPGGRRSSQSAKIDTDLVLPKQYKVQQVKTHEISASGGKYEIGDIKVGPITPRGDTLGYSVEQLAPKPTADGTEIIYILTGTDENVGTSGHAGEYSRVELRSDEAFSYYLILRRRLNTP